jgi:hypothetical protein
MEILPVKQTKNNECISINIPDPLLKPPFLGLVIGGVKSGKTCLWINMVYRWYTNKVFDGGIIVFSPNLYNDDIFENNIIDDDDVMKITEDLENIDMYVKAIVQTQEAKQKNDRKQMLIVFDDILGYIKQRSYITNFCTRYRQLKISMIFNTQVLRGIPNTIRANSTWMAIFKTYNKKELEKLMEELGHIKDIEVYYNEATKDKYSFLFINLRDLKLYKRFETLLYDHDEGTMKES